MLALSVALWFLSGFFTWSFPDGKKPNFFCYHDLTTGGGAMGDAVRRKKCGMDTYDGFNSHMWMFRLLGKVNKR
jgi:hypothetical protein